MTLPETDPTRCVDGKAVGVVGAWAAAQPLISAAWIFGSRAKGTCRPSSDLDVAVEIEPFEGRTANETFYADEGFTWMAWKCDLEDLTGLVVHLELLDGERTPRIASGVSEAGIECFRRSARETFPRLPPDPIVHGSFRDQS